ncbi:WXG100 family type VII secretion target [Streptomyces sp. NPDC088812]|uniref:WXG100 family type VII secretion target n=1 Tax=Streptomyces sp. NPDC088812 TaxID=3365905 RepID=UPI003819D22B
MTDSFTDGYIHVDYDHMQNGADDLVHQTKAIAQTLTNLDAELQALRATWSGADRAVYDEKQKAWNNAVHAMEAMLNSNAQLLTELSGNYQNTESKLTQLWADVKIGG